MPNYLIFTLILLGIIVGIIVLLTGKRSSKPQENHKTVMEVKTMSDDEEDDKVLCLIIRKYELSSDSDNNFCYILKTLATEGKPKYYQKSSTDFLEIGDKVLFDPDDSDDVDMTLTETDEAEQPTT